MCILKLNHVKKYYKKNKAIDDVSFQVKEGEIFGLIGENGAGKSTMISMISTLSKPNSGEIKFKGIDIVQNPKTIQKKLGFVPQEIALYTMLSGFDNLKFFGNMYHIPKDELQERINEVIKVIGLSEDVLTQKVSTYSGGMSRRLNIGVALLHHPELIILDEPTVGIDVQSRTHILEVMKKLSHKGTTVIYVGHYMEEIEKLCDSICILRKGKVLLAGNCKQLIKDSSCNDLEKLYLKVISE